MKSLNSANELISILICSLNRRKDLEYLVDTLKAMNTAYSIEIVVVEETNTPVSIPGTHYIPHSVRNLGIAYARNLALEHAKGTIIVFLDDDCLICDGWLDKLIAPFQDQMVVGVQGGVTVPESTNLIGWAETILGFPGGGIKRLFHAQTQTTREVSTLNCAYRKWAVEKVGGFDNTLNFGGEDYLLAKQVCGHCVFVPEALVYHKARESFIKIWKWFIKRGRAEIDVIQTDKQHTMSMATILKSSLTVKLIVLFLLCSILSDWSFVLLIFSFFTYYFLQVIRHYTVWQFSKSPFSVLILLPAVKMTMDIAADIGRLKGLVLDKKISSNI